MVQKLNGGLLRLLNVILIASVILIGGCIGEKTSGIEKSTLTPEPTVASTQKKEMFSNSVGMEFVQVPAGEFEMGLPIETESKNNFEKPLHHVKISKSFLMSKYEVTQKQWRDIMGRNPAYFKVPASFEGDDRPIMMVSWKEVNEFVDMINKKEGTGKYRLPTEAEWEYAARAGTTTIYSFGDDAKAIGDYAWYNENSNGMIHPVGQKNPNPWGLYDIHGNVEEWVQDEWHENYEGAPVDGSEWKKGDDKIRIIRVFRDGNWNSGAEKCRSAGRDGTSEDTPFNYLGFRLVKDS
ncbi:Hercynine oxygenase [uncultured archaeon]|nr:Hercynine oxygenase [uncultured archaeon]